MTFSYFSFIWSNGVGNCIVIGRNEEFADVSVDYSVQVFVASSMITMFPKFLRP